MIPALLALLLLCPRWGDATIPAERHLNELKNRTGAPVRFRPVTIAAMLAAGPDTYPEGAAGVLEGWVIAKHHEGPEACNCGSATRRDWHIVIGATKTSPTSRGVVVEITPHMALTAPAVGTHVRVSGWFLFDQNHVHARGRGTALELHPVTSIVTIP